MVWNRKVFNLTRKLKNTNKIMNEIKIVRNYEKLWNLNRSTNFQSDFKEFLRDISKTAFNWLVVEKHAKNIIDKIDV